MTKKQFGLLMAVLCWVVPVRAQDIVINEIMYHAYHVLPAGENPRQEWVELYNRGTNAVDLSGWRLTRSLAFTITNATLGPKGYLVIAADAATFRAGYPAVTNVIGGWVGKLSNTREEVRLVDAQSNTVCSVTYADSGEWAVRARGPMETGGYQTWTWLAEQDGGGKSLELINPNLPVDVGQNWLASATVGGTPGAANSVAATNIAPLILEVNHTPVIPRATDPITVTARLVDEAGQGLSARLYFGNGNASGIPSFSFRPMFDDGQHNDGLAGDGIYAATIPAQPHGTVIEYYVSATDGQGAAREWPAPALDQSGLPTRDCNALFQVDTNVYEGTLSVFRLIMPLREVSEMQAIRSAQVRNDAQVHGSLVNVDARGTVVRQRVEIRLRGAGSRFATPSSYRVGLPSDAPFYGVSAINLNARFAHSQLAGSLLARMAGLPTEVHTAVQVRTNAINPFAPGGGTVSTNAYVLQEVPNSEFAAHHFPEDSNGNIYRASTGNHNADLSYQGTLPSTYENRGFSKTSNQSEYDWSDLIQLCTAVSSSAPDSNYVAAVKQVVNVEEWMLYFALFTVTDSMETSIGTGVGDDFMMYRGMEDPRFKLMGHDWDTILGQGDTAGTTTANIFRMVPTCGCVPAGHNASNVPFLNRFMWNNEFVPIYFRHLKNLVETTFAPENLGPLLDQHLGVVTSQSTINNMKLFAAQRNASVLSQIPLAFTVANALPIQGSYPYTTVSNLSVTGFANAIDTRTVLVNGVPATWVAYQGRWTAPNVALLPGINSVLVQCLDASGQEFARTNYAVWYDTGLTTDVAASITDDTIWTPGGGPYRITQNISVLGGATLTVQAGTTVYFAPGVRLSVEGRLQVQGTAGQRVRFTADPASAGNNVWVGIVFADSAETSRISYLDLESAGGSSGHSLSLDNASLVADHITFSKTSRGLIELSYASLHIKDSVFPTIVAAEHIHGGPIPPGGYVIIEGCIFGGTSGLNDIIDFTGAQRPGPVLQVISNIFTTACDDVLDLDGTDAHIEGNIFMNVHRNNGSTVDTSSAISGGRDGTATSHLTIVRNLFYDCDHAVLAKEGNYYTIVNNTMVKMTQAAVNFDEPGRHGAPDNVTPGRGAFLDGNIIWNTATNFENVYVNHPTYGTTELVVNRSILSGPDYGTNGVGNLTVDPHFNLWGTNAAWQTLWHDLALLPGSPALGAGPNGLDLGAVVPRGASISGEPASPTAGTTASLAVGGPGITHYRYRVNQEPYATNVYAVGTPIVLTNLTNGNYSVSVLGLNSAGVWQPTNAATLSHPWTVDTNLVRVVINEVLARNVHAVPLGVRYPDLVELYNPGGAAVDLGGLSLSDDPAVPRKFVFPAGVKIDPGQYLVLYADNSDIGGGLHLRFALDDEGDGLYLYDTPARGTNLLDTVRFGLQLADLSIGRLGDGSWALNQPTLGGPNIRQPVGDPRRLKINEWLTYQATLFADDFIELYNPDPLPVSLAGLSLSDNPHLVPPTNGLPALSFIAGSGFRTLLADGHPELGPGHLGFQLSTFEGLIALFAADQSLIDLVRYGPQFPDVSSGRSPDGATEQVLFNQPTPGAGNPGRYMSITETVTPLVALANAWKYDAAGIDRGSQWVQTNYNDATWSDGQQMFYHGNNAGSFGVPINVTVPFTSPQQSTFYFRGWFNYTGPTNGVTFRFTHIIDDGAVFYLNGREFYRTNMNPGAVAYATLANQVVSGAAQLAGPYAVTFNNLVQGSNLVAIEAHQSDLTSSDIAMYFTLEAVAFQTNYFSTPVVLNEVLAKNQSLTNVSGKTVDWVELFNPSTNVVDLYDLSLSDSLANPRRWVFPLGAAIAPGGYYVVEFDDSEAYTANNAGFELSANSGALYLFQRPLSGGGLVDVINYGTQVADLSIGRYPAGAATWRLCAPTRSAPNVTVPLGDPNQVRLNEWMPDPKGGEDWFELYNPGNQPVALGGLHLTDDLTRPTKNRVPALSFIGTGAEAYVRFHADGDQTLGADHVSFKLSNTSEAIGLFQTNSILPPVIDWVVYTNAEKGVSQGRLPDGSTNLVRFVATDSPGEANYLEMASVVINEVLAHTDPPLEDAVEVRNLSDTDLLIGGWFLSDSRRDLKRYRIPDGTILAAGGYTVFYENQFNTNVDVPPSFAFSSARGDEVYLAAADALGNLTGYRASVQFGASAPGVSFGRYETSTGVDFAAMSQRTFGMDTPTNAQEFRTGRGRVNAYPLVGPVVIHEIHYHPPDSGTNDNQGDEFIELLNLSTNPVTLYDENYPTNGWRLRDAVDFDFPVDAGRRVALAPGAMLLVVSFDPATNAAALAEFRAHYGLPANALILGPYAGKLANDQDNVELYRPDTPELPPHPEAGYVPYVLVDRVRYQDSAPWPVAADGNTNGLGLSLQRRIAELYGNDPVNWVAAQPSPLATNQPAFLATPTITAQPQDIRVQAGSNVLFTVSATGEGVLRYQWRLNGVPVAQATNAVLAIAAVSIGQAGQYSVLVNNEAGVVLSAPAKLVVTTPPIITLQPEGRTVAAGADVTFAVTALGAELVYQWRLNGSNIAGATGTTFALTNVPASLAGSYDVVITNSQGITISTAAALVVVEPPLITGQPQNTAVVVTSNAVFHVGASGGMPMSYQWRFNGVPLLGGTNDTLTLNGVQGLQAGNYDVVLVNFAGRATSETATLTVLVPPTVSVVASRTQAVEPGAQTGQFTFSRTGAATNDLTVTFRVEGSAAPGADYAALPTTVVIPTGASSTNLVVTALDDALMEGAETVLVRLTESADYFLGAAASATVLVMDDDNVPPVIKFLSPSDGDVFPYTPTNILLLVNASDVDGIVDRVDYFAGTNLVGWSTNAPFSFLWTNAPFGTNRIKAVATDTYGATGESSLVFIWINRPPQVSITSPLNGMTYAAGGNVTVNAFVSDPEGLVTNVLFYAGTNLFAIRTNTPYSAMYSNAPTGSLVFRVAAVDDYGVISTSSPVAVNITAPGIFDDFDPGIDMTQ